MARTKKQTPMAPCASALVLGQTTFGLFRGCWSFDCSGTVNVEADILVRPLMLECNGEEHVRRRYTVLGVNIEVPNVDLGAYNKLYDDIVRRISMSLETIIK